MTKRCTVIVPTVQPSAALQAKLLAIYARIEQLADMIVVVDAQDAPASFTETLQTNHITTLILGENRGVGAARNAGVNASTSEYFLPLDDDDDFDPKLIEKGLEVYSVADSDLAYVYCWTQMRGDEIGIIQNPRWSLVTLLKENPSSSCALIRRSAWSTVGGYTEELRSNLEDWDLWLKFAASGFRGQVIEEVLFTYHRRSDSALATMRKSGTIWEHRRQLIERHRKLYETHMVDVLIALAMDAYGKESSRALQIYRYLRIRSSIFFNRLFR